MVKLRGFRYQMIELIKTQFLGVFKEILAIMGLFWIWWVKCILRYSPAGEGVEGTTKTQRAQRLIDHIVS